MAKNNTPKAFTMSTADIYDLRDIENRFMRQTILSRLHAAQKNSSEKQRLDFFGACIEVGAISQCGSINGVPLYAVNYTHQKTYTLANVEK